MSKNTVINIKTDPELKKRVAKVASELGVSINAVLNNELRRFATEKSVVFATPEIPNAKTHKALAHSRKEIERGDYRRFKTKRAAVNFLRSELK